MSTTFAPVSTASTASSSTDSADSVFSLTSTDGRTPLAMLIALAAVLVYAYWEVFEETAVAWSQPQYSHGWIIPLIALFIMWSRRPNGGTLDQVAGSFAAYTKPVFGAGAAMAVAGKYLESSLLSGVGFAAVCFAGLAACLLGQPFSAPAVKGDDDRGNDKLLWGFMAASMLVILPAIGTQIFGYNLPVLHPGFYQVLGLLMLCAGGLVAAYRVEPGAKVGLAEAVFGAVVVGLSVACWVYATGVDMIPLKRMTFVTTLFGLFSMVGGLRLLRWAGPAVGFVIFMYPLPTIVEDTALRYLQKIAVVGSEVVLTLLGCQVVRIGNKLEVEGIPMEVIEACSGLSMSTILIAMAVAMALLINRPWWDKLIVLLSAVPIAIISNVFRIVSTGLLWVLMDNVTTMDDAAAAAFRDQVHNLAGILLMMPFALGLYWLEFRLLSMLTVEEDGAGLQSAGVLGRGAAAAR